MVKTTVYLNEREATALRGMAAQSGRSQAEIIREAIASAADAEAPCRLRFANVGQGPGEPVGRHSDEIVRREFGQSKR
jgi:hypothetical protein